MGKGDVWGESTSMKNRLARRNWTSGKGGGEDGKGKGLTP